MIFDRFRKGKDTAVDETLETATPGAGEELNITPTPIIGEEQIKKANVLLLRYKGDKQHLDEKIVANEQWWKLRHWETLRSAGETGTRSDPKPASAWLWNCIVSKHADAMDAYPEPNVRPRMPDDVEEAKRLKEVIPVVLEQNDFESVYNEAMWYKLIQGTGVYGVFWDGSLLGGLGDIAIRKIDLLSLFWQSGVTDIQQSPNLFYVTLVDNDVLEQQYPQLKNKLGNADVKVTQYRYDDHVDTSNKSAVVDWYYKRYQNGKKTLHYCKYVGSTVLFATENEPDKYPNGWYEHGQYPFVFDRLFAIEGTPCGYGYIDICKSAQEQIDTLNQSIVKNAALAAKPRYFFRSDGAVNEAEFCDPECDLVHVDGNLGEDSIRQITVSPLNNVYVNILSNKIEELKETSGNRDVANGGSTSGVTAASAIAAMQEAGGKLSRDANKASYNAYKQVVLMCIDLMRQFYDAPRWFMIRGETGQPEFAQYNNRGLVPQMQDEEFGQPSGYRLPVFDIEVNAQKASPYSKMAQNELTLQLLGAGFFAPGNAQMALAALDMMDFDHKDDVAEQIKKTDSIMQTAQLAMQLAMQFAPALVPQIAQALGTPVPSIQPQGPTNITSDNGLAKSEASHMTNARAQAQEATQVR